MTETEASRLFDGVWEYLAERGFCDAAGGKEHMRLRAEFGEVRHLAENPALFIITRADIRRVLKSL